MLQQWSLWLRSRLRLAPAGAGRPGGASPSAGPVLLIAAVLMVAGFWLGASGDAAESAAQTQSLGASAATWGDVLGFDAGAGARADRQAARDDLASAQSQSMWGRLLMAAGVLTGVGGVIWVRRQRPAVAASAGLGVSGEPAGSDDGVPALAAVKTRAGKKRAEAKKGGSKKSQDRRPCPRCAESIKATATMCRYCQLPDPFGD